MVKTRYIARKTLCLLSKCSVPALYFSRLVQNPNKILYKDFEMTIFFWPSSRNEEKA